MKQLKVKLAATSNSFVVGYDSFRFSDKYLLIDNDLTLPLSRIEKIILMNEEEEEVLYHDNKRTYSETRHSVI